jgi:hypothetical protein
MIPNVNGPLLEERISDLGKRAILRDTILTKQEPACYSIQYCLEPDSLVSTFTVSILFALREVNTIVSHQRNYNRPREMI